MPSTLHRASAIAENASPRTLDDFVAATHRCATRALVLALLDEELAREGYRDLAILRLSEHSDTVEVLHGPPPAADVTSRFDRRLWAREPALAARLMAGGLTMPFPLPNGQWDIVSVHLSNGLRPDAARLPLVNMKAYAAVQQYNMLSPRSATLTDSAQAKFCQGRCGCETRAEGDCRILAIIDVAKRRYEAGLLDLNERIPEIVGQSNLKRYISRGLVTEEPDDLRFNFVFKTTVIGKNHLKNCPMAPGWRREVWTRYVEIDERPQD